MTVAPPGDPDVFHHRHRLPVRERVSTECPRCGSTLTTLSLGGAEAVSCEECGYVGVEADHSGEPHAVETWAEALERFARRE